MLLKWWHAIDKENNQINRRRKGATDKGCKRSKIRTKAGFTVINHPDAGGRSK